MFLIKPDTTVTTTGVFIDKIAITFNVPKAVESQVADRVRQLNADKVSRFCPSSNYVLGARMWLNEHLAHELSTNSCVTFHTTPKTAGNRSCRVEWNPAKVSAEDVAHIVFGDYLDIDFALLNEGVVTRIDLAVDVENVLIDELLFHVPRFRIFRNDYSGGVTRYLGGRTGSRYFCCYDKQAQIAQNNKRLRPEHRESVPGHPRTRIEARIKGSTLRFPDLRNIENPFEILSIRKFTGMIDPGTLESELTAVTLHLAQYEGLNAALDRIGGRRRKRVKQAILASQISCDWWCPKELWSGFHKSYDSISECVGIQSEISATC